MYRGDADWRAEPCLDFTFDIGDGLYGDSPVVPGLVPLDRNVDLDCGETLTDIHISDTSPKAFWRVQGDHTANQAYRARRFNIVIDDPNDCAIILSNVHGFTPYITVNRNLNTYWQGPLVDGKFLFTVEADQTGPMTVEVSTLNVREQGSFDIELDCSYEPFDPTTPLPGFPEVIYLDASTSNSIYLYGYGTGFIGSIPFYRSGTYPDHTYDTGDGLGTIFNLDGNWKLYMITPSGTVVFGRIYEVDGVLGGWLYDSDTYSSWGGSVNASFSETS